MASSFPLKLQRELLDQFAVWPDLDTVQAAVDAFRTEYTTNRPHQSLDMAFPADRCSPRSVDTDLPLRLPPTLAMAKPVPAPSIETQGQPALSTPLMDPAEGIDPINLAVEVTRIVPASGNLTVCGQRAILDRPF